MSDDGDLTNEPVIDMNAGEVVPLRPFQDDADAERPLATRRRSYTKCWHGRYFLDDEVQRAYCRDCGREIPLFDVLREISRGWERFIERRREAQRKAKVAEANLDELLRKEKNAKVRVRKRRRRDEPESVEVLRAMVYAFQHRDEAKRRDVLYRAERFLRLRERESEAS